MQRTTTVSVNIGVSMKTDYSSPHVIRSLVKAKKNQSDVSFGYFEEGIQYINEGIKGSQHFLTDKEHKEIHDKKIAYLVDLFFSQFQGLIIPGNCNDINPVFFEDGPLKKKKKTSKDENRNNRRNALEIALVKEALKRLFPVLGICGGHQIIAVALGGTIKDKCDLEDTKRAPDIFKTRKTDNQEFIAIHPHTILHSILANNLSDPEVTFTSSDTLVTREYSAHGQAAHPDIFEKSTHPVFEAATDENGIVKAIEVTRYPFLLGTQFHPEHDIGMIVQDHGEHNNELFIYFIEVCKQYAKKTLTMEAIRSLNSDEALNVFNSHAKRSSVKVFAHFNSYYLFRLMKKLNTPLEKIDFIIENQSALKFNFGLLKFLFALFSIHQRFILIDKLVKTKTVDLANLVKNYYQFIEIYNLLAFTQKNLWLKMILNDKKVMQRLRNDYFKLMKLFTHLNNNDQLLAFEKLISYDFILNRIQANCVAYITYVDILVLFPACYRFQILNLLLQGSSLFDALPTEDANSAVYNLFTPEDKKVYLAACIKDIRDDQIQLHELLTILPTDIKDIFISELFRDKKFSFIHDYADLAAIIPYQKTLPSFNKWLATIVMSKSVHHVGLAKMLILLPPDTMKKIFIICLGLNKVKYFDFFELLKKLDNRELKKELIDIFHTEIEKTNTTQDASRYSSQYSYSNLAKFLEFYPETDKLALVTQYFKYLENISYFDFVNLFQELPKKDHVELAVRYCRTYNPDNYSMTFISAFLPANDREGFYETLNIGKNQTVNPALPVYGLSMFSPSYTSFSPEASPPSSHSRSDSPTLSFTRMDSPD